MRRLDIAAGAKRDIDRILYESAERYGRQGAERYRRLMYSAFRTLRRAPRPPGSRPAEAPGLHLYLLRPASRALPPAQAVGAPPHIVAYRFDETRVEIVRLLHEAMDLPLQLGQADPS